MQREKKPVGCQPASRSVATLHWPSISFSRTALTDLVRSGKIRAFGTSTTFSRAWMSSFPDDVLDRIDEIVPPGTDVGTLDQAYVPPAIQNTELRRRPLGRSAAARSG